MSDMFSNQVTNVVSLKRDIDARYLLTILMDGKWKILASVLVGIIFGVVAIFFATPVYKADALLRIEETPNGVGGVQFLLRGSKTDGEIRVIQSRLVILGAINKANLDIIIKPKYFPLLGKAIARRYKGKEPASAFLSDKYAWGGEKVKVSKLKLPDKLLNTKLELVAGELSNFTLYSSAGDVILSGAVGELVENADKSVSILIEKMVAREGTVFNLTKLNTLSAINYVKSGLEIKEEGPRTGVVSLTKKGPNKEILLISLNAIVDVYKKQNLDRRVLEVQSGLDFLEDRLPEIKTQIEQAEDKLNAFRKQSSSVDLTIEAQSVLGQLVQLDTQLNALELQEIEVANYYTENHPTYQALIQQKNNLLKEKQRLTEKTKEFPQYQQEILTLSREVEVGTGFYAHLVEKIQELNVIKASIIGNVQVLDRAVVYPRPIKPKKALLFLVIVGSSLLLGVFSILIYRLYLRPGIDSLDQLEKFDVPVYATVPLSRAQKELIKAQKEEPEGQARLLSKERPMDVAVESLRSIRTSLHFAMMEADNNILMITGATPGIGKSFVSSNLACLCADSGQKILLIDADLRKGHLQKTMGVDGKQGLSEVISGVIEVNQAIESSSVENLDFLARGQIPPNPSELLMSEAFKSLLNWASNEYDLVIVDTPPVLAVTDAAIVGRYVGTTLFIVRYQENTMGQVEQALAKCNQNKIDVKGCVFNAVEKTATTYEYYSYEYRN